MSIPYGPILVVEDVPQIRQMLEVTLKFKGYPVVTVANGQEALEQISREHPALIITDILMPKLDGFALVQRLRTDPRTRAIPIIFLSATYVTPDDKAFALKLGATRFLEKPVDTEDFLHTVAEVLTDGPFDISPPLGMSEFYKDYRARLESKLRHKSKQITRTERLLETIPDQQRPALRSLLQEARASYEEMQRELENIYRLLEQHNSL